MNTHEQYEELCALAASGQASPVELADLSAHLDDCPDCRAVAYDFTQVSAQVLSQIAAKKLHCQLPSGMTQRFVARARSEGILMSREDASVIQPRQSHTPVLATGAIAAVVLLGALLTARRYEISRPTPQSSLSIAPTQSPPARAGAPSSGSTEESASVPHPTSESRELKSLRAKVREQEREIRTANADRGALTSRLGVAEQQATRFESEKEQLASRLAELQSQLEKAKTDNTANDVTVALRQNELRDLQSKLAQRDTVLGEQQELIARGSDVRDLIVARNLHIIDVHDRDGDGKSQRAFGRIFYTEGKSLIFYAYDLANPRKLDAKVSFCVWGERLGSEKPIRSLGMFRSDDANDGRWILTFDDPQVLAQIDSIFVTAQSGRKAITEPAGKRILFAFLGDKPNHP